ncbi:transcriptional regulator, TetR family [Oceanobacillus limi]|uniref:Transcriptional regulator, TetR family n=1 Tax=Oceanobacillus limi TaxID=930131 RepID=A0A1H9XZN0_9BACI|nr:TetR/AcrR family transcriptional regulator [Oceanobacillus limi]SES61781.1 transcriptional regulator, TetR family [Oceanobacillus limi]
MATDRRINKSKQALKDALILRMETSDFKKITITEIVQHANLNRGTFYKHYDTKEALLEELIDDVMCDLIESYRAPYLHSDALVIKELTASKIKIFEHVYSYSKFYRAIVSSNAVPGIQHKISDVFKQLSRDDMEILGTTSNVDRDFVSSYYAHALLGLILEWINSGFKYTPAYMAEQLIAIVTFPGADVKLKQG